MLLYIHIPFCKRICSYCDFFHSTCMDRRNEVVRKIAEQISLLETIPETVYIGGGTPSILTIEELKAITPQSIAGEFTMEANPDDITEDYCRQLLDLGINRLSIGVQSFDDRHLKIMNRRHDSKQAIQSIKNARKAGFKNITADLIYGLPFMTPEEWKDNLNKMTDLGLDHISAYHLTIEEGTIFWKKKIAPVTEEVSQLHYDMLLDILEENGYRQYEISNFAKDGFEAVHNSGYWSGKPYIGIGPSAHSFDGEFHRWWQPCDIAKWLAGVGVEGEYLSEEQRYEEIVMTSLRTVAGLETHDRQLINRAGKFISQGIMEYCGGFLRIRPRHMLISDYIISEIF